MSAAAPHPTARQLQQSISTIKGVGPRMLPKLGKLGIATIEDALYHLPTRYEDRRQLKPIGQLVTGTQEVFVATVLAAGETCTSRSRRKLYEVIVGGPERKSFS